MSDTMIVSGVDTSIFKGKPYKVILFNDDHHDMAEVMSQIMKAINCGSEHAYQIMIEAHRTGRAVVWSGHRERCEHIASILEAIRLGTKVEPA